MHPLLRQSFIVMALMLWTSTTVFANTQLNGLALHEELGKEQFIGSLYTSQSATSVSDVLNTTTERTIELRVLANRYSKRRFNRMWVDGMAVNNPSSTLSSQANNIVRFTKFIKGRKLIAGDRLSITARVGEGTIVSLNSIELGVISDDSFFNLLLKVWIGNVPLSSDFREGLLQGHGKANSDLLARFEALQPTSERLETVRQWRIPTTDIASANTSSNTDNDSNVDTDASANSTNNERPRITPPSIALTPPQSPSPSSSNPNDNANDNDSADTTKAEEETPELAAAEPSTSVTSDEQVATESNGEDEFKQEMTAAINQPLDMRKPSLTGESTEDDDEYEAEEVFTAESLIERQRYVSSLLMNVRKNIDVRKVVFSNREIRQQASYSIRLDVIVNRQGELQEIIPMQESEKFKFNKVAWDAVTKSFPFKPVPISMVGKQFEFSIPMTFNAPKP